mgnify:CR=1 FL=1
MALDYTVRVFDQFYNTDLSVNGNDYEIVYSFFKGFSSDTTVAKSFTETLFRISNITKINVLELLDSFESSDSMKVSLTMAYYLNSLGNKTVMYGVSNTISPNQVIQRNIVQ